LLDESAHDALDHTGLTGIPAAEAFTQAAHDELDHAGLTGVPDKFDWDMDAATPHRLVDHSSQLGVPDITGLLDETAHDSLDHTGLTGIPEITGLLEETAHDLLDHDGLPGIGDGAYRQPIALEANLPVVTISNYSGNDLVKSLVDGSDASTWSTSGLNDERATKFILPAPCSSLVVSARINGAIGQVPQWQIWRADGGDGYPGTMVTSHNAPALGSSGWQKITYSWDLSATPLEAGTYWLAVAPTSGEKFGILGGGAAAGAAVVCRKDGNWKYWAIHNNTQASILCEGYSTIVYDDGDIVFTQNTNKFWRWNEATLSWIALNPTETPHAGLLDETAHDALDHTGLTGVPDEFDWDTSAATPHRLVNHAGIPGVPSTTGLLDETAHDLLDHTGLTGVGSDAFVAPVSAFANLPASGDDGDLVVVKDSHKIYVWDAEAATPCWRETNREITHEGITVDPSSWRNFQISLIDRSMLNILDFECIISKIQVPATDGNATPAMDYDIELFTDSSRTVYAHWAQNIDSVLFEDKIPFLWEGGSTIYGRIVNNKAAAITDLDIIIKYRV
jgi:hypothetical protein